uniref:Uncharacterized protein n=1 Tax=Kalanchoe fedtschenkoi TaxID=63787 RepID=A0A7N0VEW8_KALFE
MGNCQAVDTASLVIQHPTGKSEKLLWPIPASQIMKSNPGHYVALLITTTTTTTTTATAVPGGGTEKNTVRITRVKLLRPTDTLTLGHVYRLISTQEVMKGLVAKKQAKMMKMKQAEHGIPEKSMERALKQRVESDSNMSGAGAGAGISRLAASAQPEKSNQMSKHETQRQRSTSSASSASRSKAWQPSLKSISESQS